MMHRCEGVQRDFGPGGDEAVWVESFDAVVFRGLAHDVALLRDRPDPQTFEAFVLELERSIRAAVEVREEPSAPTDGTAAELQSLADLQTQGVINQIEFQDAKRRLLAGIGESQR